MTTLSGWCLRPYSVWSKDQHDKCPKNFATGGTCSCTCGHPAERSRDTFDEVWAPVKKKAVVAVAAVQAENEEEDSEPAVDTEGPGVYAKRVPTEGGAQALLKLRSSHEPVVNTPKPEPRTRQRRGAGSGSGKGRGRVVSPR